MAALAEGDPCPNSKAHAPVAVWQSALASIMGQCSSSPHVLGCWGKDGNKLPGEYDL